MEIVEKLFLMQENFIRKLDQQIEKTEQDKGVQDRLILESQGDDGTDIAGYSGYTAPKIKSKVLSKLT